MLGGAEPGDAAGFFPLARGNWWAYAEEDADGTVIAREVWTIVDDDGETRPQEFHLRSFGKRRDVGRPAASHPESHEYLRAAPEGVYKRFAAEAAMLLVQTPPAVGAEWQDAQGRCQVARGEHACAGPRGMLAACIVIVCRLGEPTATEVTSTYARGVGMVRQEVTLKGLAPAGAPTGDLMRGDIGGRSILRLTAYEVR